MNSKWVIMNNKYITNFALCKKQFWLIIMLLAVGCNIFGSGPSQENIDDSDEWSEPTILYINSDTVDSNPFDGIGTFSTDVNGGKILSALDLIDTRSDRLLDSKNIIFLEKEPKSDSKVLRRFSSTVPGEQPIIKRDRGGTFHLLWGDRRQDPAFEHWEIPSRSQLTNFSTNVVYTRYNGTGFEPPVSIYEGNLSTFGVGSIGFPLRLIEAEDRRLHAVFKADSMARTTTTMGDSIAVFIPRLVYMNRSPLGEWSRPRFIFIKYKNNPNSLSGGNPVIAATTNRLVVSFLSSVGGVNDVLTITSDDGGHTWSDAKLIFSSGRERSMFLTMKEAASGQLHIVWARVIDDGSLPEELWHSYSEDEGRTWSQPVNFFTLESPTFTPERSPEPTETIISDYDIVVDEDNRLHWAGIEVVFEDILHNRIHYTSWDPVKKTWQESSVFKLSTDPGKVKLSFDDVAQKLYIFWKEIEKETILYSVK